MKKVSFKQRMLIYGSVYVDGTKVTVQGIPNLSELEAKEYIKFIKRSYPNETVEDLLIKAEDKGFVSLDYTLKPIPFQRIRRITGYLVGDMNRWGNAKRAEERDRVKHTDKIGAI